MDGLPAADVVAGVAGRVGDDGGSHPDPGVACHPAGLFAGFLGGGGCFAGKFFFGKQFAAVKGPT